MSPVAANRTGNKITKLSQRSLIAGTYSAPLPHQQWPSSPAPAPKHHISPPLVNACTSSTPPSARTLVLPAFRWLAETDWLTCSLCDICEAHPGPILLSSSSDAALGRRLRRTMHHAPRATGATPHFSTATPQRLFTNTAARRAARRRRLQTPTWHLADNGGTRPSRRSVTHRAKGADREQTGKYPPLLGPATTAYYGLRSSAWSTCSRSVRK